jgi:vacuolar protein sorting-associated protein 35
LDCLKKGVKIASQVMDNGTKVQLYVELLNKYVYFYEKGVSSVKIEMIQELMERVREESRGLEPGDEAEQIRTHFANTLEHIRSRMEDPEDGPSYEGIKLG